MCVCVCVWGGYPGFLDSSYASCRSFKGSELSHIHTATQIRCKLHHNMNPDATSMNPSEDHKHDFNFHFINILPSRCFIKEFLTSSTHPTQREVTANKVKLLYFHPQRAQNSSVTRRLHKLRKSS